MTSLYLCLKEHSDRTIFTIMQLLHIVVILQKNKCTHESRNCVSHAGALKSSLHMLQISRREKGIAEMLAFFDLALSLRKGTFRSYNF